MGNEERQPSLVGTDGLFRSQAAFAQAIAGLPSSPYAGRAKGLAVLLSQIVQKRRVVPEHLSHLISQAVEHKCASDQQVARREYWLSVAASTYGKRVAPQRGRPRKGIPVAVARGLLAATHEELVLLRDVLNVLLQDDETLDGVREHFIDAVVSLQATNLTPAPELLAALYGQLKSEL